MSPLLSLLLAAVSFVEEPPAAKTEPVKAQESPLTYACHFTTTAPRIDGDLSDDAWDKAPWSSDFVDIRGGSAPAPRYRTRMKMLWDDKALYVCAKLADPHVWGTLTEKNAVIYQDNDFEIFIDPDGDGLNYYEFEMNALGTIWELTLDKPYSKGGQPTLGTNLPGLKSAVKVQGTINDPSDEDQGWTVEVAIPWADMTRYLGNLVVPLHPNDTWRINFSRVQWKSKVEDGKYVRLPAHGTTIPWTEHPEDNWVWSPQGAINMHIPEKWGRLKFEH
ncbi:MAG: hypothetical protein JWO82_2541 [Akkermansiaceae bacterium]|nr:hypothetical protein [Akkermansiaceae bacterium]